MHRVLLTFLLLPLLLTACAFGEDATTGGRIILWHSDDPVTGRALDELVERFMQINPDIRVSVVAVPEAQVLTRYREAADLSLGPDLFIADSRWIMPLADEGLIQPLDDYEPALDQYLSTAVENITYEGSRYGIPYGLLPNALYYNADLVDDPPETLTALLAQAAEGAGTAITSRFDRAMWGLRAFGGQLFDEQGRVALDQGGFSSWLTWLDTAQNATGIFINSDRTTLLNLFTDERVAYYIGTPADLRDIHAAMGENANIRVAPLPAGASGPAGPLLHVETFLFNQASATRNTQAALALARFLTNDENSLRLAREIGHVPANLRVPGIDARTYPIVNGFMTQARTALPIRNTNAMFAVLDNGDRLYRQVLDGVVDASTAAADFTAMVNEELGFVVAEARDDRCTVSGEIRLWHAWQLADQTALNAIIDSFEQQCPAAEVSAIRFNSPVELVTTARVLSDSTLRPDVLLLPDTSVFTLASEELIQPVLDTNFEQFTPAALNALTYQNRLYGTPVAVTLTVLYFNRDQVTDPPRTLDDLITEAGEGRSVAIDATFEQAYWGIPAFGGTMFGGESPADFDPNGAQSAWLAWLQEAAARPGFIIEAEATEGIEAFAAGEVAYYIGSSQQLSALIEALGRDTIAITGLPAGPAGEASPLLRAEAFMLSAALEPERLPAARAFVDFATDAPSQLLLFSMANRFPANVNVTTNAEIAQNTTLGTIQSQVARATVYPVIAAIDDLRALADAVYRDVLRGDITPAEAVARLAEEWSLVAAAAAEATPEATPEPEVTPESTGA